MDSAQKQFRKVYGGKDAAVVALGFFALLLFYVFYKPAAIQSFHGRRYLIDLIMDFLRGSGAPYFFLPLIFFAFYYFVYSSVVLTKECLSVPVTTGKGYPAIFSFFTRKMISVPSIKKIVWFRIQEDMSSWSLPSSKIHVISADPDEKIALSLSFYGEEPLEDFVEYLVKLNGAIVVKDYDSSQTQRYSDIEIVPGGHRYGANVLYRPRREKK